MSIYQCLLIAFVVALFAGGFAKKKLRKNYYKSIDKAQRGGYVVQGVYIKSKKSIIKGSMHGVNPMPQTGDNTTYGEAEYEYSYEYEVAGKKYIKKVTYQFKDSRKAPVRINIYYDPANPANSWCREEIKRGRGKKESFLIGLLAGVIVFAVLYFAGR